MGLKDGSNVWGAGNACEGKYEGCMEVHGGAWRCMEAHGGAWRCMEVLGGAWRCLEVHGLRCTGL